MHPKILSGAFGEGFSGIGRQVEAELEEKAGSMRVHKAIALLSIEVIIFVLVEDDVLCQVI